MSVTKFKDEPTENLLHVNMIFVRKNKANVYFAFCCEFFRIKSMFVNSSVIIKSPNRRQHEFRPVVNFILSYTVH